MTGQETRNKLTDYWGDHDIKEGQEFAFLTNLIHQEWTGLTVKGHKQLKGLRTQNLRDHMTEVELIFTALAEVTTRQIAERMDATGMPENAVAAQTGGSFAREARERMETLSGQPVVSPDNALPPARKARKALKTNPGKGSEDGEST